VKTLLEYDQGEITVKIRLRDKGHLFSKRQIFYAVISREKAIELFKKYEHELTDIENL
jgi:hypothetical protein